MRFVVRDEHGRSMVKPALAIVAILCFVGDRALACTCVEQTLATYFHQSPAVFIARLTSVKQSAMNAVPNGVAVRVRVVESWKGASPGKEINIATGTGGGDCGYEFERFAAAGDSLSLLFAHPIAKRRSWL